MRGGVSRHPSLEPCSQIFPYGTSMSHLIGLTSPTDGNLAVWSSSQPPEWEIIHGLMRPPLHAGAIMIDNSSLSQRLILA